MSARKGHALYSSTLQTRTVRLIIYNASPCLNMHFTVFYNSSAQSYTTVHLTCGTDIANGSGIDTAAVNFSSSMISMALIFGAPETVPAGKPATSASITSHSDLILNLRCYVPALAV